MRSKESRLNGLFGFTGFVSSVLIASLSSCAAETDASNEASAKAEAIVGGREATPGAWPGTVALISGRSQVCGGSLIAPQWVLTAAHCLDPRQGTRGGIDSIIVGRHALSTTGGETIAVASAIRHESFNDSTMSNDIALLRLSRAATSSLARIATAEEWASVTDGTPLTVVGWGRTREGGSSSNVLREVAVPLVSQSQCNTWYGGEITSAMFCAGVAAGGIDSCQGDSGGPIFDTELGAQPTQVGVVSWGDGCAKARRPGVYARLANYWAWFNSKSANAIGTAQNGLRGTSTGTNPGTDPGTQPGTQPGTKTFEWTGNLAIPDNAAAGTSAQITSTDSRLVDGVEIEIDIEHTYRGDLRVVLEHGGRSAVISNRAGGSAQNLSGAFTTTAFDGVSASGAWILRVADLAAQDTGSLQSFAVTLQ